MIQQKAKQAITLIKEFEKTKNLMTLADAYCLIKEILDQDEFPTEQYTKWLKEAPKIDS